MFDATTLITYVAASAAIILAPGPAQALVLARSLGDGSKSGVVTAVGLNVGTVVHALAAALGLSAVLATSAAAFAAVKYSGAAYLVYLGVKSLTARETREAAIGPSGVGLRRAFTGAVVVGTLNPKVAVFFLAFLPQFVDPRRGPVFLQFLVLGLVLAALDAAYESILASVAGGLSGRFARSPRFAAWRQRVTGAALVGLGVRLAMTERE